MQMGYFKHSISGGKSNFIVFAEAARMISPAKCTLDNPASREFFPFMRFDLF